MSRNYHQLTCTNAACGNERLTIKKIASRNVPNSGIAEKNIIFMIIKDGKDENIIMFLKEIEIFEEI